MVSVYTTRMRERHGPPVESPASGQGPQLNVHVIFTNLKATRAALQTARELASDLGARIIVLVAQVVPYPLPLAEPPIPVAFTEQALLRMAGEQDVETSIQVRLCRDRLQAIQEALRPHSVVVIGRRWWSLGERILAWTLRRDGHHLIHANSHPIL